MKGAQVGPLIVMAAALPSKVGVTVLLQANQISLCCIGEVEGRLGILEFLLQMPHHTFECR